MQSFTFGPPQVFIRVVGTAYEKCLTIHQPNKVQMDMADRNMSRKSLI